MFLRFLLIFKSFQKTYSCEPSFPAAGPPRFFAAILLALIGLLVFSAQAQPAPEVISFQGRLTDANGQPVADGTYQLQFHLYDQPNGGTLQWTETQVVTTRKGVFTALLGAVSPLSGLSFEDGYYVALGVNGSAELEPRTPLAAVPYALSAQRLDASALEAGSNVTITRQGDGALRIEAAGGGTGGGLTRVTTDATLAGEGTASSPLRLSDEAVVAGQNVTVTRENDGSFVIDATGGGGGGLSQVATDATLGGDGTAGAPLSLADGAVTGAKLADGVLQAGSNISITPQGDGSLEVAATATPLSLPYTGTVNSSEAALSIENTGGGDGIHIANAGNDGIEVLSASYGLFVDQASSAGVFISSVGAHGVVITSAGGAGLSVGNSFTGVDISTTTSDGIFVGNAGRHGLLIQDAASNGIQIGQTTFDGVQIQSAGGDGVRIVQATNDGVVINSAGRFGLNVENALRGVDINTTTDDGVLVRNAGTNGLRVLGAGDAGVRVEASTFTGLVVTNPGNGQAAVLGGDVQVTGTLSKAGGSFKIDHPLDPANKYLAHSFVESPDMMNVYNGNVVLDARGEAVIELPDYFEVLNRDFRYQLTAIGAPGPNLYVAEKISGNRFRLAGGVPGMEVSWQVTGIRQDAWANEHRIVVEQAKPTDERGYYLHPAVFGQPRERGLSMRDTVQEQQ